MDQTEENGNGKRVLVEGEPTAPPNKACRTILIKNHKTDLTLLKKFRASLNKDDLETFRARFGKIDDILDIEVDLEAITAILQFYVPELRCFVFPNFDLTPTIEEYLYMLALPEGVSPSKVFIPDLDKPHTSWSEVHSMMKVLCGLVEKPARWCFTKTSRGYCFHWNQTYLKLKENLINLKNQEGRINFLALGIYGLVLLPTITNQVDSEVICLIKQLIEHPEMNVAPLLLAETFRTFNNLKANEGFPWCSFQLFTMWIHGHFPRGNPFYGCCRISSATPAARFCKLSKKIMTTGDWYKMFYSAKPEDVNWRVGWLCVKEYIAPPKNRTWIPLIGIKGMTSYTPNLVMRQLSNIQEVPNLRDISEPEMNYDQYPEVKQQKLILMAEEWKNCEIKRAEMKLGTTSEYTPWRQTWIKDRVIPPPSETHLCKFTRLNSSESTGFYCQFRQLKQQLKVMDERNILMNVEKWNEVQKKLLELEEKFQKGILQEHQDESGQVSTKHQGELRKEQQGESRKDSQDHKDELRKERQGETGQERQGESGLEIHRAYWLGYIGSELKGVEEQIEELRQETKLKMEDFWRNKFENQPYKKRDET